MNKGFLYVATGEKYIKEAEQSAKSLKGVNSSAHITLVTDNYYSSDFFDNIIIQGFESIDETSWKANLVYKVMGIAATPYDQTVFLDTDTFIVEPFDELFDILDYFDVMVCPDYYDKSTVEIDGKVIKGYTPYNTGVLAYRKNQDVDSFLETWKVQYEKKLDVFWSDQPAFMLALVLCNVKLYSLHTNYNFRFLNNVGLLDGEKVKIIHGRATVEEFKKIEEKVNITDQQRAWSASLQKIYTWETVPPFSLVRNMVKKIR